jgi:hypothetical protein
MVATHVCQKENMSLLPFHMKIPSPFFISPITYVHVRVYLKFDIRECKNDYSTFSF